MLLHVVKDSHGAKDNSVTVLQMRKMIKNFKHNPEGGWDSNDTKCPTTCFANFPISQILDLLKSDGVITDGQTVSDLINNGKNIAVNIYFAQHVEKPDCPATPVDYVGYNTVFLVTCVYDATSKLWNDVIDYSKPEKAVLFIDKPPHFDKGETGTDKANLCPPQCKLFGNHLSVFP